MSAAPISSSTLREDPEENVNVYDATDDQSARVLRRLEARRQIQTFAGSDEDWDARSKELSEEALENLRALGYIR
jgi:DNA-binding PadR family transcriptional regulator